MDVNEPEAGGSTASLRLGLTTALFSTEWTVRHGWLQREEREVLRGKVISLSFYKGEWLTWAADWGLSQSKAPILSLIHYFLFVRYCLTKPWYDAFLLSILLEK